MKNLDKVYAEKIAEEYAKKSERKVVQLKKLDNKVKRPVLTVSIIIGIIASLLLGSGMSIIMTDFGPKGDIGIIIGISLGILGLTLASINYPLHKIILSIRKEKYAFEIIEIAKEIVEEN